MRGSGNGKVAPRTSGRPALRVESGSTAKGVLITGGAGFVGANLADRLLSMRRSVTILDNCSRPGVERNIAWLRARHGRRLTVEVADVRDAAAVRRTVASADAVFHFAAQVAVTTSLSDPIEDFDVNARGTLTVLEAIRACPNPPSVIMTSTNKVYGQLGDVALMEQRKRWEPQDADIHACGISESRPLDFHSPYGCSKGAADQYVLDYARSYGLRTSVFRMSCIYGPRQLGTEDQGWVAHFVISALEGQPVTVFGDGRQVRDILFVEDLVDAFVVAMNDMERVSGRVFNVGGGPTNTVSLLELLDLIAEIHGSRPPVRFHDWRTGDQRYYVSDTTRLSAAVDWSPRTSVHQGVARLYHWLMENRAPRVQELALASRSELLFGEQRP